MPSSIAVDPRYTAHAQYRQFVDFAQGAKKNKNEDLFAESRGTLVVGAKSKSDFIGNIFRSSSSKAANDEVRSQFKSAIMGMFGVTDESKLPDSVKEAMKLDDFGKGKPLTARRILAVQTTVDQYFADKAQTLMAEAVRQGVEDNEMTQRLVRAAVRACIEDPEAMELVKANIRKILIDFTTSIGDVPRPVHGVKEKVDAITANLRALRAFAGDDATILAAGKEFVHLKAADFNVLMAAVAEGRQQLQPHLDQILKHPRGAQDMDAGVRAFGKAFDETLAKCGNAVGLSAGSADAARLKSFVVKSLLHRDGDAQALYHDLDVAVKSDAAKQLKALYRDLAADLKSEAASPGVGAFNDLPDGLRHCMADHVERASAHLDLLNDAMYDFYEVPANERRPVGMLQGNTRAGNDFRTLGQTLQTAGRETLRADRDAFVQKAVKGTGTAAERMRAVFARKIDGGSVYRPADDLKSQGEETIRRLVGRKMSEGLRTFKNPSAGMANFASLLNTYSVTLPGGAKLSGNMFVAQNQLAAFVTGGAKTSFNSLTQHEKNKVYVVMSLVSQSVANASYEAPARMLNPTYDPRKGPLEEEVHKPLFRFPDDSATSVKTEFTLELGADGGLKVGFTDSRYISRLETLKADGRTYDNAPVAKKVSEYDLMTALLRDRPLGSTVGMEYLLELKGEALDRLADSKFDNVQIGKTDMVCSGFQMSMMIYDP